MLKYIISEVRIKHWLKNLFIFAPFIFTPEKWSFDNLILIVAGFFAFSFMASAVYIINDLHDAVEDKLDVINRKRPYASGKLSKKTMYLMLSGALFIGSLSALLINIPFFVIAESYLILNIFYTLLFEKIKYVNYSIVAVGFVLRVIAGCAVIHAQPSIWIVLITFVLTYYVSVVKVYIREKVKSDKIQIEVLSVITPLLYITYTFNRQTIAHFGTDYIFLTSIPVIVGFIYTFYKITREGGKDIVNFFTDKYYWSVYFLWLVGILIIIGKKYF